MTFGKRLCMTLGAVALGALISASAVAQVTTRLVTAGGAAVSTKIIPGGTASIDVQIDVVTLNGPTAGGTGLIGTSFTLNQSTPPANGFFSLTGRSFVGSPFNDPASGTSDAIVLVPPSNLLDPANNDNIGRQTVGLVPALPVPPATYLAANMTLTSSGATPLGTYTVNPTAGLSFATDDVFNDYSMSGGVYTIIVGQTLSITKSGTGTGTVTSDVGVINCGATCSDIYPGSVVTLTAVPTGGDTFIGWTGGSPACSGTGTCVVTVDVAQTVNAQFGAGPQTLTVTLAGTGTGTVTSVPAGISCAPTCTFGYAPGTPVTLTAAAAVGSTFTGWSGGTPACSGTGTCVVTMNQAQNVTATFLLPSFTITVTKSGNGIGVVTDAPDGTPPMDCGAVCVSSYTSGTTVVLTATPNATPPTQVFAGWSGSGCSGTGTCTIVLTANSTVDAQFTDVVPPTTALTGTPTNPSSVPNPVFTFNSPSDPTATFQCSLDGSPFVACVSPHTVSVGNGTHTFSVRAVDQGGNVDPAPPIFTWLVQGVVVAVAGIPTLSEWMLVLLALVLGSAGILARRRKG